MSTVDVSSAPPVIAPRAPVEGIPITGAAVFPVAANEFPSTCTIESGFSTEASAICATFSVVPLENVATIVPPAPILILESWLAGEPFWVLEIFAEVCAFWLIVGSARGIVKVPGQTGHRSAVGQRDGNRNRARAVRRSRA